MIAYGNANPLETGNDDFERFALEECIRRQRVDHRTSVLITPAGRGELAIKFASVGADVLLSDALPVRRNIGDFILAGGWRDKIRFAECAFPAVPEQIPGEPFDIVVTRRGLCNLRYEQARRIVRQMLLKLRIGGKLFVSILGLHSELGDGYGDHDQRVEARYARLSPAMANKYGITEPLCLYSERNLFMLLVEAGASVLRTMTSTYGNVKGIAVRV